jgi:WD40 repeat protein
MSSPSHQLRIAYLTALTLILLPLTAVAQISQSPRDIVIDLPGDAPKVENEAATPADHGSWRFVVEKEFGDVDVHFTVFRFSHDGKTLCAAGEYGECILWDTATWKELRRLKRHTIIWDLAFSADDKQLLTCGQDGKVALWNLASGELVKEFSGHTYAVRSCAISPDGTQVMGGGGQGIAAICGYADPLDLSVRIWDVASGK